MFGCDRRLKQAPLEGMARYTRYDDNAPQVRYCNSRDEDDQCAMIKLMVFFTMRGWLNMILFKMMAHLMKILLFGDGMCIGTVGYDFFDVCCLL